MLDTSQLVKDVGTMLEGEEAVKEGLIDEVGGDREALDRLYTHYRKGKKHRNNQFCMWLLMMLVV